MISCYYFFSALLISRAQNLAFSCISLRLQSSRLIFNLPLSFSFPFFSSFIIVNELIILFFD